MNGRVVSHSDGLLIQPVSTIGLSRGDVEGFSFLSCVCQGTLTSPWPPFTVWLALPDYKVGAYTGRLHSRRAILMPPLQEREQVPKGLHTPQAPSTGAASCSLTMHRPCLQCWDEQLRKRQSKYIYIYKNE